MITSTDLSIVIVNWNTRDLLQECLASIYADPPGCGFEIWVIDNASGDASVEMVRENYPDVKLIANTQNLGFAAANNQALAQCAGRYFLLLNTDTLMKPLVFDHLIAFMEKHPDVGAAGPRLLYGDGSFQLSVFPFPTLLRETWRMLHLDKVYPLSQYNIGRWGFHDPHQVDSIRGACLILRKETLQQVGFFDPDYFFYSEEIDLCFRIHRAGWKLYWLPDIEVVHYEGQSSQRVPLKSFLRLYQGKVTFFRKNHGRGQVILYKAILSIAALLRLALTPFTMLEPTQRRETHLNIAKNYFQLLKVIPGF